MPSWSHAASEKPHESASPPRVDCTICGFKFHCKEARIAHTGRQCATCGLRFKEVHRAHMDWHFLVNSRKRKEEAAQNSHLLQRQCATCGAEFSSDQEHRAHMDWHFYRNKRIKSMCGAEEKEEANAVPADEGQEVCPMCGEGSERFFSEEADDWMCKRAVYMNVPAGCFYEDIEKSCRGPILHVNCR
ncbi:hypothetical protein KP509_21G049900 [Ceratopteris richardii]|uniref:C2H2-type domain-containing protein n=1 Tax=Ceratopteris richardii TaxID=49495 RepID=A0A8T2SD56_CERRI|nr:hypothetical protein KP509_21G049900 [Ceratopteris richardii]